ncbi:cyclophilin-like domain-containing protein [Lenzites betulinus]|nr:cyclophilin-like domain-containing protein [Lenzites betulinus]
MVHPRVFFDISVDNQPAGRIIFELYNESAPKTSENFRALCTGEKGLSPLSERPLYYKNSIVHRSISGFMIQGGDFTKRNGTGGESIYGGPFPDEDLSRPLDSEGLLCMANKGPNTNNSQFFITLRDCPHLNGKHVVFGRVIRGYDIVERIADLPTDEKDRPRAPVVITNCGELMLRAQPQKEKAETRSASESVSDDQHSHKKRRHRSESMDRSRSRSRTQEPRPASRSRSRSVDSASPERKRHKSSKKSKKEKKEKKHKSKKDKSAVSPSRARSGSPSRDPLEPVGETESQYDARLEREENERIEAARKRELERVARRLKEEEERRTKESGGVRFKGRGRMKYLDPELQRDRT